MVVSRVPVTCETHDRLEQICPGIFRFGAEPKYDLGRQPKPISCISQRRSPEDNRLNAH